MIEKFKSIESYRSHVKEAMNESDKCLIFDMALPWIDSFFSLGGDSHPAKFIIMPSHKHWKLQGIPPSLEHRMSVRAPLPEQWAGLSGESLVRVSGIEGAVFCHKGRFMSIWLTKNDALRALDVISSE